MALKKDRRKLRERTSRLEELSYQEREDNMNRKKIYFTEKDFEVLSQLTERFAGRSNTGFLEGELDRAEVVPDQDIPAQVVTLHSRARVLDEDLRTEREVTIVPPEEAKQEGYVSVLAPLGAAIIGVPEEETIEWPMQGGKSKRFRVTKVLFQPEADAREKMAA